MKKRLICLALGLMLLLMACGSALAALTPVGQNLSKMNTTDLDGNVVTGEIFSQYNLTVLNYWATWCGPCVNELPNLQQLYKTYKSQGVNVLGFLCESNGCTPEKAKAMIKAKGLTYNTILQNNDRVLDKLLDASGGYIPDTYIIDNTGKVVDFVVGGMSYAQFESLVKKHFPQTTDPVPTPTSTPTPTPDTYEVRFIDWDETELSKQLVSKNAAAQAPASPPRDGYVFWGWDKDFSNVTSNLTVQAQYIQAGDINNDNDINTGDAVLILRYVLAERTYNDRELELIDINKDGVVNTGDATALLKIIIAS